MRDQTLMPSSAYLAFAGFENELAAELVEKKVLIQFQHERLFVTSSPLRHPIWAQDIWTKTQVVEISSIGDAVKKLKAQGKLWACYSLSSHRRASLIQDQLLKVPNKPLQFMQEIRPRQLGSWALLNQNQMIFSPISLSPFPLGEFEFDEDKKIPPSRAYLKLWELFTVHGIRPSPGQKVVDLGSSPGGWTWVLQQLGCHVISVDKAALDERIRKLPRIESLKKDAFKLTPQDIGAVDWLFSDIICYPKKLLEYLAPWIASPVNLACTLKFQGDIDPTLIKEFLEVPGSQIVHLHHNKHEVTWLRVHAKK